MASTYLTYTQQSPSTAEAQKFTLSMWVKKYSNGANLGLYGNTYDNTHRAFIYFNTSDALQYFDSNGVDYTTTRLFRDSNAFYHLVISVDTTLSSSSDRIKFYVNGVRETSFSTTSAPNQNDTLKLMNTTNTPNMGRIVKSGTSYYLNGVMSHVHFTQGYTYDATPFGETDSTTGEWKIKTSVTGINYGTNGFWWLKDSIATTDHSPNSNSFSVSGGTLTKTEDCPSNVFATLNKLQKPYASQSNTLSFGNTQYADNNSNWQRNYGTIGATTGKYFYEFKCLNDDGNSARCRIGWDSIDDINASNDNYYSGLTLDRAGILRGGEKGYDGYSPNNVQMSAAHSSGNFSFTAGDILGMGIDIDNNTFSVYKNGNLEINAYSYASSANCSILKSKGHFIAPSVNWYSASGDVNSGAFNFGNGYFGNTAVSSAGTNASGNGIFEYDVPTGYTAFSTKGLNL